MLLAPGCSATGWALQHAEHLPRAPQASSVPVLDHSSPPPQPRASSLASPSPDSSLWPWVWSGLALLSGGLSPGRSHQGSSRLSRAPRVLGLNESSTNPEEFILPRAGEAEAERTRVIGGQASTQGLGGAGPGEPGQPREGTQSLSHEAVAQALAALSVGPEGSSTTAGLQDAQHTDPRHTPQRAEGASWGASCGLVKVALAVAWCGGAWPAPGTRHDTLRLGHSREDPPAPCGPHPGPGGEAGAGLCFPGDSVPTCPSPPGASVSGDLPS